MISRVANKILMRPVRANNVVQQIRNSSMKPKVFQEKGEIHVYESARDLLPFNPFQNKWLLTVKASIYIGSVFSIPFWFVYWNTKKSAGL